MVVRIVGGLFVFLAGCQEYAFPDVGNNGYNDKSTDTAAVSSEEPIADAGADQDAHPRMSVILDGSGSWDPHKSPIVAYQWSVKTVPSRSSASLSDLTVAKPTVYLDLAGTYVFELAVQNADGYWDSTPDRVQVRAVPEEALYVEVTWDEPSDLDLHLLEEGGPPFTMKDCTWCNPAPSWGANGPMNDPNLVVSTTDGYGPEVVAVDQPEDGTTYNIAVHYYGENGEPVCAGECAKSVAIVRVYVNGVETGTYAHQLNSREELWTAGKVAWPAAPQAIDAVGSVSLTNCVF